MQQYVALGDSIGVGLWGFPSYPRRYEIAAQQVLRQPIRLNNLSQSGWTTDHMLAALRSNPSIRQPLSQARIVTWNIGGNDLRAARDRYKQRTCGDPDNQLCLRQAASRLKANWVGIVAEVNTLRPDGSLARTMDLYNPYVTEDMNVDSWPKDGGLNDFQVFKIYFDDVNAHINSFTPSQNIPVAHVYAFYNGASGTEDPRTKGLISFDGFHPNTAGHAVLANLLLSLGLGPIEITE